MKFYSEVTLPESKTTAKVRQFTFADYITANKFIQNGVNAHIQDCYIELAAKYSNSLNLAGLDALVVLIFMRVLSVGGTLKLTSGNTVTEIDLYGLLQSLSTLNVTPQVIVISDNISIIIKTPAKFIDINKEDFIHAIIIDGISRTLLPDERCQLYNSLPANTNELVAQYITVIEEELSKIQFSIAGTKIECSYMGGSLFELVKVLYTANIINCFKKVVNISNSLEVDTSYIVDLPPAEVDMFSSFVEEQRSANQEPQSSIPIRPA